MNIFLEIILPVVGIFVLVAVVGFFASSETAFLSITKVMLHQMLKKDGGKKNSPAKKIQKLKQDTDKLLSLILIGINFVTSLASALAAAVATRKASATSANSAIASGRRWGQDCAQFNTSAYFCITPASLEM